MRLLTLSQWYDPEPNFKGLALATALQAKGHTVTAVTGFPNYPSGKIYPGYRLQWRQWETMNGVRVLRVPLYPDHSYSSVKRILNYASFALSASTLGAALCGPADVMWVYHPPLTVGIPAWWIGLLRRIPFVYEVQDLWPETLAATGMFRLAVAASWMNRLAQFVYRRAAAITVISPGFKRNLIAKGVPAEKIHVIPNWADEELYRPVARDENLAFESGLANRFNIMFAGNIGAAQALETVLEAAELLRDLPRAQFVLIGDGVSVKTLRQATQERGLSNVRWIDRQPAERMSHWFALADVMLVHLKRDPLFEITIPSKTMAYLACGRPILCAVAGDTADLVRSVGAGITCAPQDPAALAQAVRDLYAMSCEQREAMGEAGRRAFLENYTQAVLVNRYEALFKDVVARAQKH
jgi:glycosyltransferase involved in cell wall biosynthesis